MIDYWEGDNSQTNNSGQRQSLWFHKNSPLLPKIQQQDIEKLKGYKEKQINEDIEPINPFNFEEGARETRELQRTQKDDIQQKELWPWHLKLNHLSFQRSNDGISREN